MKNCLLNSSNLSIYVTSSLDVFRPPGAVVWGGLTFYCWCFYFLFFVTRSPSSIGRSPWNFAIWPEDSFIGGPPPPQKKSLISDIQNRKDVIESDSSGVRRKKYGELWSTNNTALHVDSDPPKSTFWEYDISVPGGCCRLKFLHVLEAC